MTPRTRRQGAEDHGLMPVHALGARIVQRLKEMDRDQRWLAMQLRKSPSTVSRWIDGSRQMRVNDMRDVALVLHRPIAWLLGDADSPDDDDDVQPADQEDARATAPVG
jgi:transcriptional regulator with XRE-family HTH domain